MSSSRQRLYLAQSDSTERTTFSDCIALSIQFFVSLAHDCIPRLEGMKLLTVDVDIRPLIVVSRLSSLFFFSSYKFVHQQKPPCIECLASSYIQCCHLARKRERKSAFLLADAYILLLQEECRDELGRLFFWKKWFYLVVLFRSNYYSLCHPHDHMQLVRMAIQGIINLLCNKNSMILLV